MLSAADLDWIVSSANELGFDLCGVARAEELADGGRFDEWLARGYAGEMHYLFDPRRANPTMVIPNARSVIVCAINYNTPPPISTEAAASAAAGSTAQGWISRYAWGDDYHKVVRNKLEQLLLRLRSRFGQQFEARAYADTGPISERSAAHAAGLGWLAKNTCLINSEIGSWLFLGVIVTSLEMDSEQTPTPAADLCGNCRLCLDACPTNALVEPYVLDARRCIAYLTIELRGSVPEELRNAMGWHVFGCDICQDVCPWNRAAPTTSLPEFQPREHTVALEIAWLLALDEQEFRRIFRGSAVKRTKWRGLLRNACIAAGNAAARLSTAERSQLRGQLESLCASSDAVIADHARWALNQFS